MELPQPEIAMKRRLISGLIMTIAMASGGRAQAVDEYQVKAAFLFNFAKFVEWPPHSFASPSDPITICVLGPNPFGHTLEDVVRGKSVDGHVFGVRQIAKMNQAAGCQILFVAGARKQLVEQPPPGVLIVGESEKFAQSGGIIGFRLEGGKVRLEINVEAAEQRKLRISSKLLSLAEIVHTAGDK
jgi:hypothetical protein